MPYSPETINTVLALAASSPEPHVRKRLDLVAADMILANHIAAAPLQVRLGWRTHDAERVSAPTKPTIYDL